MQEVIAYVRVSKREQATRRNGIEGQMTEIKRWAEAYGFVIREFVEECASRTLGLDKRPRLAYAIAAAKRQRIPLVVSKLDRFSGNVAFIGNAMEDFRRAKVTFYVATNGLCTDTFRRHIEASVAQNEIDRISYRIKTALVEVKRKGKRLGNNVLPGMVHPDGRPKATLQDAQKLGGAANRDSAVAYATTMRHLIEPLRTAGKSFQAIADELNRYQTPTARGGKWSAVTVCRLVNRWG